MVLQLDVPSLGFPELGLLSPFMGGDACHYKEGEMNDPVAQGAAPPETV